MPPANNNRTCEQGERVLLRTFAISGERVQPDMGGDPPCPPANKTRTFVSSGERVLLRTFAISGERVLPDMGETPHAPQYNI